MHKIRAYRWRGAVLLSSLEMCANFMLSGKKGFFLWHFWSRRSSCKYFSSIRATAFPRIINFCRKLSLELVLHLLQKISLLLFSLSSSLFFLIFWPFVLCMNLKQEGGKTHLLQNSKKPASLKGRKKLASQWQNATQ